MKFPRIAKVIGFTEAEFETQDGAIAFSIEHTEAIEAKLNDHSVKKEEWKTERASLESTHQAALEAEQKKTAEATEALGKMTLELAEAKEKIQSLEDEPADKSEVTRSIASHLSASGT